MYKVLLALTLSSLVSISSAICMPIGTLIGTAGFWKAYYEHANKAQQSASLSAYINSNHYRHQIYCHKSESERALKITLLTGVPSTLFAFGVSALAKSPRIAFWGNRAARFLGRATVGGGVYGSILIAPYYLNKLR